jgi:flagellar basal body-associated protein FliL
MKEAEGQNVEQTQGAKRPRRRGRLWIVLVAVLVVAAIAGVFFFGEQSLRKQLRAMADEGPGNCS